MSQLPITPDLVAQMQAVATSAPVPVDLAGDAFDAWIAGATVAKRSVVIYGRPDLIAAYEDLERQIAAVDVADGQGEMAGGADDALRARLRVVYDEWMASKSTWTVRAVDVAEAEGLRLADPVLEPPAGLPEDASDTDTARHELAVRLHRLEVAYRVVAAAVERIEFPDGRASSGITVDRARRLGAQIGERQVLALQALATVTAKQEFELPAPFSRRNSSSTATS